MPVKNGVYQLIQYLEVNNIRYAVATSNDRAMALELLEAADLRGVFEYMVCGDEVEHGKPFGYISESCGYAGCEYKTHIGD